MNPKFSSLTFGMDPDFGMACPQFIFLFWDGPGTLTLLFKFFGMLPTIYSLRFRDGPEN